MASTINQQIESHIQNFVSEITTLVRTAALDSVHAALGGTATPAKRGPGRPKGYSPKVAKASGKLSRRVKGARRSSEDVDATAAKFLAFVRGNNGKRLEEISKGLGIHTHDLKLPAQKLLAAKSVKTTGAKRGTKYHLAGSGAGSAKAAPAKTPKRAKKT